MSPKRGYGKKAGKETGPGTGRISRMSRNSFNLNKLGSLCCPLSRADPVTRSEDDETYGTFQSTPPRGGRRAVPGLPLGPHQVSIHAPARGATRQRGRDRSRPRVSIHAPARGATLLRSRAVITFSCFNPRPRAGGDCRGRAACSHNAGFNPRPRAGGDTGRISRSTPTRRFNPRPRAGGDRACSQIGRSLWSFNPRPRAGGDTIFRRSFFGGSVSIHAPARGATSILTSLPPGPGFNPRPRAGGDAEA